MAKTFHLLLALIASATDRELAKYVSILRPKTRFYGLESSGRFTRPSGMRHLNLIY